jgi:HD superfamily phosphodiesterase
VELQPDGSLRVETVINGQRLQEPLSDGYEIITIRAILHDMKRSIDAEKERKAAILAAEENSRHRRVWRNVAADHGELFANKTVGRVASKTTLKPDMELATEDLL